MSQQLGPLADSSYAIKAYFLSLAFDKGKRECLPPPGPQRHPQFIWRGWWQGGMEGCKPGLQVQTHVWKEVRLVQKGEGTITQWLDWSFGIRNPKCDLGQGFCKTEKINNLPKVIQLDMTELGIDTAQVYAFSITPFCSLTESLRNNCCYRPQGWKNSQEWFCSAQCMTYLKECSVFYFYFLIR